MPPISTCLYLLFFLFWSCAQTSERNLPGSARDAEPKGTSSFRSGLYLNTKTVTSESLWNILVGRMEAGGWNLAVIDAQPTPPTASQISSLKSKGIYPVARIVNFEGGLKTPQPSPDRMASIQKAIRTACKLGFHEIQLDYIRYADGGLEFTMSQENRYKNILGIIQNHKAAVQEDCSSEVKWSADIFGRVPFIENDGIGQRVEPFSQELDVLYPMLYPSHFYGLKDRVNDPYTTIKEGIELTKKRSLPKTKAIAWIQGFKMSIGGSGLTYPEYIKVQMQGAYDAKGDGFVIWNAGNEYEESFEAFQEFQKNKSKGN